MPKFNYVAMDSRGKETKGTLEVNTQNEAIGRLKEMGFFPTKVVEVDKSKDKTETKSKAAKAAPLTPAPQDTAGTRNPPAPVGKAKPEQSDRTQE